MQKHISNNHGSEIALDRDRLGRVVAKHIGMRTLCITVAVLTLVFSTDAFAGVCHQLKPRAVEKAKVYIARRLGRDTSDIVISADAPDQTTLCFTRLIVTDKAAQETFVLFMSKDGRFLTGELYDLALDPVGEERRENEKTARLLREGATSTRGSVESATDIVLFADLQCPYCRQVNGILEHFLSDGHHDVRLIYRAYPIPSHSWAYEAAEIVACVQLQSTDAFWQLYGYILQNQSDITAESLRSKVDEWIKNGNTVDDSQLNTCMTSGQGKNLVDRDLTLGRQLDVVVTPTLFVNGARLENTMDENKLQRLILEAEHQAELGDTKRFP